jgi:hypothetical protein
MSTPQNAPSAGTPCPNCATPLRGAFCTTCGRPADVSPPPHSGAFPTISGPTISGPTISGPTISGPTISGPAHSGAFPTIEAPPASGAFPVAGGLPDRAPAEPGSIGRIFLIGGLVFLLLVGVGVGGTFGYQWWRDRPMTQALDSSATAFADVADKLDSAENLNDLSQAGAAAPKAAATVEKAVASIKGESGELARLTRAVLEDQVALLEAIAPMEGLSDTSLTVWSSAQPAIEEAQSSLLSSRRALTVFEKGLGEDVRDPRPSTEHAAEVVADQASSVLRTQLEDVLNDLADASTTSQAAAIGERTATMASSADAAGVGQSGSAASTLDHLSDAFTAINTLSAMDPETLYLWGDAKSDLATATDALGIDSTAARDSMSAWVETAQERMDQWRLDYEEAESQRSTATVDLDSYSEDMKRILRAYDRARDATADALGEEDASSYDIEWAMEEGVSTRQDLLDEMEYLYVPDGMSSTHSTLTGVLQRGVEAMMTGEWAVEEWNSCYYECEDSFRDTSGWQEFSSASSDITTDFDSARKAWVSALETALGKANAVPLPPMPSV